MRQRKWSWSVVVVLLLTALAVVLVVAALRGPGTPPTTPIPKGSAFHDPSTVGKGETTKPSDARAADVEPPLVLVDAKTAFRGTTGTCLGGSTLERTTDAGATWQKVKPPAAEVLSIDAESSTVLRVVGADDSCEAGLWNSVDGGIDFNGPSPTAGLWFRQPATNDEIQTASAVVKNPCPDKDVAVVELEAVSSTDAAVLCPNGTVKRTEDGGEKKWIDAGAVQGEAVALAWLTPEMGWVLQKGVDACPGFQVLGTTDGGATWLPRGCVGDAESVAPGSLRPSLSFSDPLIAMASLDGSVFTTKDGGTTWTLS